MTVEYYSPDNLGTIVPHLHGKIPKWLILGGPADGREAQRARELWPEIKIVGVEPNPEAIAWQTKVGGWPNDCPLVQAALSYNSRNLEELVYESGKLRNASTDPDAIDGNRGNPSAVYSKVKTVTLDDLDWAYGPFEDAILWMDIEGAEWKALLGSTNLLVRRAFLLVNVEMQNRIHGLMEGVHDLLSRAGYHAVQEWNASETCRDRIYVRVEQ